MIDGFVIAFVVIAAWLTGSFAGYKLGLRDGKNPPA